MGWQKVKEKWILVCRSLKFLHLPRNIWNKMVFRKLENTKADIYLKRALQWFIHCSFQGIGGPPNHDKSRHQLNTFHYIISSKNLREIQAICDQKFQAKKKERLLVLTFQLQSESLNDEINKQNFRRIKPGGFITTWLQSMDSHASIIPCTSFTVGDKAESHKDIFILLLIIIAIRCKSSVPA